MMSLYFFSRTITAWFFDEFSRENSFLCLFPCAYFLWVLCVHSPRTLRRFSRSYTVYGLLFLFFSSPVVVLPFPRTLTKFADIPDCPHSTPYARCHLGVLLSGIAVVAFPPRLSNLCFFHRGVLLLVIHCAQSQ